MNVSLAQDYVRKWEYSISHSISTLHLNVSVKCKTQENKPQAYGWDCIMSFNLVILWITILTTLTLLIYIMIIATHNNTRWKYNIAQSSCHMYFSLQAYLMSPQINTIMYFSAEYQIPQIFPVMLIIFLPLTFFVWWIWWKHRGWWRKGVLHASTGLGPPWAVQVSRTEGWGNPRAIRPP